MKTIAKALIEATASLELSGQDVALEGIAHILQSVLPGEKDAIRETLQEMIASERAGLARPDVLNFYEHFLESFGVPT